MTVYVAEIAGRGIAAFSATHDSEAEALLADKAFLRDLIVFQNHGRTLWDGVSQIQMRRASITEAETWKAGNISDHKAQFVFLVPVVDPSSDKFDDDDDDDDDDRD